MSLTNKTLGGFFWAFLERFGVQGISFFIFIILARLLTPEQFGLIGMLSVFISISQSLTDSGFSQALIQKKDADEIDFSSVFYINLVASVVIYALLYVTAPFIADFFREPILVVLVRVLSLRFIISSFSMVQVARLQKSMDFKSLMYAKLPSTLIGGISGVVAAYSGLGVWSLVIQQIVDSTAYTIQVWIQSGWRPHWVFNKERIKSLFDFGSKIMASGILNSIFENLYQVVIGRYYPAAQVGFYTQADKIQKLPIQNISTTLAKVTFPVLSEIQTDDERLKRAYRKIIKQVMFFITPIMLGAIVVAEPVFKVVLTQKWLPAVPYFKWLCIYGLFVPLSAYNLNILKVKGRSDLFLKLDIIKKVLQTAGIIIFINYSVLALVIFRAGFGFFSYGINSYYSGSFINYPLKEQIKDLVPTLASGLAMIGTVMVVNNLVALNDIFTILINILTGGFVFLSLMWLFENELFDSSWDLLTNLKSKLGDS